MKKVVLLIAIITVLCAGCDIKGNQAALEQVIPMDILENQNITSLSPDGRYRAEAYGTNKNVTAGGLYPYEGIRVVHVESNEVLYKMSGYYTVDFMWSPDSRYVGIYHEARVYGESIVFDTKEKRPISLPTLEDIASRYGEHVKPNEVRPDPYFRIVEWESEETVVVEFRWSKEDSEYFNGKFNFNVNTLEISENLI